MLYLGSMQIRGCNREKSQIMKKPGGLGATEIGGQGDKACLQKSDFKHLKTPQNP